jgi:predicted DNA-binding transcriptional regulator AlpA
MTATKYVTTAELASHFSVSNATIMAMMKSGEIPAGTYMRLGRVFRYDQDKIENVLLTRGVSGDDAETPAQEPVQYEFDFGDGETNEENPYA